MMKSQLNSNTECPRVGIKQEYEGESLCFQLVMMTAIAEVSR